MAKNRIKYGLILCLFIGIAFAYFTIAKNKRDALDVTNVKLIQSDVERAFANYSEEVYRISKTLDLSYEYFMALIVLECSGRKPAGNRFESHVFQRLKEVKQGDRKKYENIRKSHVSGASEESLRNLATSWGPFQLMGYKCIGLGIKVKDIRGEEGVEYGMNWADKEYGKYLRKERFKDAFHYHNTGRKFPRSGNPKTHDPKYVAKGLQYMEYFKNHVPQ